MSSQESSMDDVLERAAPIAAPLIPELRAHMRPTGRTEPTSPAALARPPSAVSAAAAGLSVMALTTVLDEIDYGLMVVDLPGGRLRHANRQAQEECRRHGTLDLSEGFVVVPDVAGHRTLLGALGQAQQGRRTLLSLRSHPELAQADASLRADTAATGSVTVAVVPLPREGEQLQALLVFGKRPGADALSVGFFARLHGLTPTEDTVLLSLCRGMKPTDIADEHGVAISTVRTHVNSIRLKTGTGSIRDLVHKVATLPPMASALRAGAH
jgi:DNA-binding CsgD family transcriptional regulator